MTVHGNEPYMLAPTVINTASINENKSEPKRVFLFSSKMATLMFKKPSSKSKHDTTMIKCRKHPKHEQSPGVCSLCLRDKLSQLAAISSSSSRNTLDSCCYSSSSSLSSYYSSSEASSCSSPVYNKYRVTTTDHQGKHSLSTLLFGSRKNNVLTKSRSLVSFVPRVRNQEGESKKKKNGLFSKLFRPRNKKNADQGLVHSRTMREIVTTS